MLLQKKQKEQKKRHFSFFTLMVLTLCGLYFFFELFFNQYAMLSVDEFWFAHWAFQYKNGLPYRDFAPYKTVLGYYILLLPLLSSLGLFKTLILTKNFIALLNTLCFLSAAMWMKRTISPLSIILSLAFIICSDIAIFRSTNIRVDFFGYWLSFFSLLCLFEKRIFTAGFLIGLAFLTTQKSIWYLVASNSAMFAYWLCLARQRHKIKEILIFNLSALVVILLYLAIWSCIASFQSVYAHVFTDAKVMYQLDVYDSARNLFWSAALYANPLFFMLAPLAIISLCISFIHDREYRVRFFTTIYALTITLLLVPYKQVFPYYMIVLLPIYFFWYATLFGWIVNIFRQEQLKFLIHRKLIYLLLVLYISIFLLLFTLLNLPYYFLSLSAIPTALLFYLHKNEATDKTYYRITVCVILFFGFLNPLYLSYQNLKRVDGAYQRANVEAVDQLLSDQHDYIAGIELVYNKTQRVSGMRHLHAPTIKYLYTRSAKLKPVMLASLYQDPNATVESIIDTIKSTDVKFFVNNYRMRVLPKKMQQFLYAEYEHWWGSIYLYAPTIFSHSNQIVLKFSGNYLIESRQSISLNHITYAPQATVYLEKGIYVSDAAENYRLKLIPSIKVNESYKEDQWEKML